MNWVKLKTLNSNSLALDTYSWSMRLWEVLLLRLKKLIRNRFKKMCWIQYTEVVRISVNSLGKWIKWVQISQIIDYVYLQLVPAKNDEMGLGWSLRLVVHNCNHCGRDEIHQRWQQQRWPNQTRRISETQNPINHKLHSKSISVFLYSFFKSITFHN